jgi:hypothetical protein
MTTPLPSDPHRDDARVVRFFELAGAAGRAVLEPLGHAWRAAGARTDLLASLDRADLWLLVVHGGRDGAVSAPVDPAIRTWRFREVSE